MKKIIFPLLAAAAFSFAACDNYLDINQDPDYPTEEQISTDMILPAVDMNFCASYGNYLRIVGGYFAQQYSQTFGTGNYLPYSQFTMSAAKSGGQAYTQLYLRVISTGQAVVDKATKEGDWGTVLAAKTYKALAYTTMVDCYDSIPYTEALTDITQPKSDDGETIYLGVIAELDEALSKASAGDKVATNFLFPGGKAINWIRLSNALKLKWYMRMANVKDEYLAKAKELIEENNFPSEDVAWVGCWGTAAGEQNPFFAEEFATNFGSTQENVIANITLVGTMDRPNYHDPRLDAWFKKNVNGEFVGGVSGTNFSTSKTLDASSFNRPNINYDSPVYLITLSEIEFFKAEYYARTGHATEAQEAYENAIKASFKTAGVDGADANINFYPYDQSNWKKSIGLAKYLALAGVNNFEAWCELRRLRYPEFSSEYDGSTLYNSSNSEYTPENYIPGTLYTPIDVDNKVGDNHLLERFPHAEESTSANVNTPTGNIDIYTTPVFWAN